MYAARRAIPRRPTGHRRACASLVASFAARAYRPAIDWRYGWSDRLNSFNALPFESSRSEAVRNLVRNDGSLWGVPQEQAGPAALKPSHYA